jgi:predicted SAM-dependent methyltransferase
MSLQRKVIVYLYERRLQAWMLYGKFVPIKRINLAGLLQPRKLNLGCGKDIRPGWINIDAGVNPFKSSTDTIIVNYDLRRGLPFDNGSIDLIYSSHFFEHLDTITGFALMQECFRVLKPGGTFRVSCPDARLTIQAYIDRDAEYFAKATELLESYFPEPANLRSPIDYVDLTARAWEHRTLYDVDKMTRLLLRTGFTSAKPVQFDASIDPPSELRTFFSFYVEALRPEGGR